jgi:hypothetical protein
MGLKCMGEDCGSYNTVRCGNEEIPEDAMPVRAAEFMQYVQQQRQQRQDEDGEEENSDHEYATPDPEDLNPDHDSSPENSNTEDLIPGDEPTSTVQHSHHED